MRPHYYLHNTHIFARTQKRCSTRIRSGLFLERSSLRRCCCCCWYRGETFDARAHTETQQTRADGEREREREREKETRIYRTTTTPPKSN